ncbi:DUF445 family protein [Desulforhopalus singaporensis]|uniref:Uncharacterized membrane protein YheB, UPF0754 family n=1 Tax=Desulforhopalus singaporensis TaxID=91360 RepID=A0A1H0QIZ1_9BACT|nr:DUF445 family protein [Desulforhopalus singaporensis]SDP17353.1 Uncharacterized membrane protein YheB, UPF0754 family [Desulforhopalus singaporensis]
MISPDLLYWSKFAGPPVVGAFIGYLTNRIAIKMLFRPLRPWRVAGIRVPMTPGVIPSKRLELARNMGEVVGDHLLTSEEVGRGLQQSAFQDHLYNLISNRVEQVLQKDFGPLSSIVSPKFQVYVNIGEKAVTYQAKSQLRAFFASREFTQIINSALEKKIESFLALDVTSVLSADKREVGYEFLHQSLVRMFDSVAMEQWVEDLVHQKVYNVLRQKKSLAEILPSSVQELLIDSLEKQIPGFLKKLATLVSEPAVRDKVVAGACAGVDSFIDSLGSMSDMVRNFLKMDTVEEKIREYLIEKNSDITAWLQSEEVQQKVVSILREKGVEYLNKPIVQWVKAENEEAVDDFCHQCVKQIVLLLKEKEVAELFSSMIRSTIENHLQSEGAVIGEMLSDLLGPEASVDSQKWLKNEIRELLQSQTTLKTVDAMVDSLSASLMNKKIGRLASIVPAGVKEGVAKSLQLMASAMLASEVPGLVQSLNIRQIVTEKINSLDLLRLERLLLSIMEEQFKYINLFGALLGFIIGCLNIAFIYGG